MEKWLRRLLAAHLFGSYSAWLALLVAILLFPGHLRGSPIALLVSWVLAPIVVPILLIAHQHGRFQPWWAGVIFWSAYLLVFAFVTIGWVRIEARRSLLRERARLGLCPRCGYDLRGSPERCPECGRERVQSGVKPL